jgi:di/tricarboxylate transporter
MTPELIYTASLILLMTVLLIRETFETELVVFGTLILLTAGGVITIEEAFSGFSNQGMLTIAFLFVLAGAIYNTGAMTQLQNLMFGNRVMNQINALLRIIVPVSTVSAFMNNAPVVAMMIPMIRSWTQKYNLSLSKYLIPLSYAAILGGMCTLIGTSTNLVIHGLLIDHGMEGLGLFEISKIGVPIAVVGLLYLVVVGNKILPDRKEPIVELGENTREFVIELKVNKNYPNIGKSIEEAGLRHLTGLFLFQIERNENIIAPAPPTETIKLGDRLFFTGIPKTILELQKTPGLQLIKDQTFDLKQYDAAEIRTYEAAISASSPLVGKNVRESNFREKYGAVVIAIHRNGERIKRKIGDITLQPGDTLLLLAPKTFRKTWYHSKDFYLISDAEAIPSKPKWQVFFSIGILAAVILMTMFKVLPLIAAAGLGSVALIVSRTITPNEASNVIEYRVLIIIASAFGSSYLSHNQLV